MSVFLPDERAGRIIYAWYRLEDIQQDGIVNHVIYLETLASEWVAMWGDWGPW